MTEKGSRFDPDFYIVRALSQRIQEIIIPNMMLRRNRSEFMPSEEIIEKIHRLPSTGKPGEEFELEEQVRRDVAGVDGEFAAEIADMVYYCLQPNCPPGEQEALDKWLFLLGIPKAAAYEFCIIKYETRLERGNDQNYKTIENEALEVFIENNHPHLKTVWEDPSVKKNKPV